MFKKFRQNLLTSLQIKKKSRMEVGQKFQIQFKLDCRPPFADKLFTSKCFRQSHRAVQKYSTFLRQIHPMIPGLYKLVKNTSITVAQSFCTKLRNKVRNFGAKKVRLLAKLFLSEQFIFCSSDRFFVFEYSLS